jgi:hypothetical protein
MLWCTFFGTPVITTLQGSKKVNVLAKSILFGSVNPWHQHPSPEAQTAATDVCPVGILCDVPAAGLAAGVATVLFKLMISNQQQG